MMTDQSQVVALHRKHPDWNAVKLAAQLRCSSGYVRATAQRKRLKLPGSRSDSITALGHAARDAGLSVSDIENMAAQLAAAKRVARKVCNLDSPLVSP
jgi:hypothetical protein